MDLSTRNLSLHKVKALLSSLITADTMATGRKVKCMAMVSSPGVMDLLTKASINTVASMGKVLSYLLLRNTTEENGCTGNRTAKVSFTTSKVM